MSKQSPSSLGAVKIALWVLSVAAIGSYLCALVSEPEFYFHLTVGRWIWAHSMIPRLDIWTEALNGQYWVPESWIFDALVSKTEDLFGWTGLAIAKMLLCVGLVFALSLLYWRASADLFLAMLVTTLTACGLLERAAFSPDLLAWSLVTLSIFLGTKEKSILPLIGLLLCGALLANTSTAWFLALLGLLLLAGGLPSLLFAATAVVSPLGGKQLLFHAFAGWESLLSSFRLQDSAASIFEYPLAFLLILWCVLTLLINVGRNDSMKRPLVFAGVLGLFGLVNRDILPYGLIFTGYAVNAAWAGAQGGNSPFIESIDRLRSMLSRFPSGGVSWVLLCLVVVNSVNFVRAPTMDKLLPKREIDFIIEKQLPAPIWHESRIGPYLIHRFATADGSPTRLARFDIRALSAKSDWFREENEKRFLSSLLEVNPETILVRTNTPVFEGLLQSQGYTLRFQNGAELQSANDQPYLGDAWAVFTANPQTIE